MKGRDIIFTGLQSWDIPIGSNAKNIAIEISNDNNVLYINPPMDIATRIRQGRREAVGVRQISKSLWVADLDLTLISIGSISNTAIFDTLNRSNNKRFAQAILCLTKSLNFHNFIHIIDNDIYRGFYLKDYLRPEISIYYRRDWLQCVGYWTKQAPRLEPLLMAKSDMILTNSPYLAEDAKQCNKNSYYIGQGVDLTQYDPSKSYRKPADFDNISNSVIGYIGAISSLRLDPDMLYEVASSSTHHTFMMVGNEDQLFRSHSLHSLDNVIFTGPKEPSQLPDYINYFDVCMNPQVINQVTIGNYPRKIDEYLAMGKAVIATKTPTMAIFDGYVYLAENSTQYDECIKMALDEDGSKAQKRIEFAQSHSWKNSVSLMYNKIEEWIQESKK